MPNVRNLTSQSPAIRAFYTAANASIKSTFLIGTKNIFVLLNSETEALILRSLARKLNAYEQLDERVRVWHRANPPMVGRAVIGQQLTPNCRVNIHGSIVKKTNDRLNWQCLSKIPKMNIHMITHFVDHTSGRRLKDKERRQINKRLHHFFGLYFYVVYKKSYNAHQLLSAPPYYYRNPIFRSGYQM